MVGRSDLDERERIADGRDAVADDRELVADRREADADERERAADQRDADADEWEDLLHERRIATHDRESDGRLIQRRREAGGDERYRRLAAREAEFDERERVAQQAQIAEEVRRVQSADTAEQSERSDAGAANLAVCSYCPVGPERDGTTGAAEGDRRLDGGDGQKTESSSTGHVLARIIEGPGGYRYPADQSSPVSRVEAGRLAVAAQEVSLGRPGAGLDRSPIGALSK